MTRWHAAANARNFYRSPAKGRLRVRHVGDEFEAEIEAMGRVTQRAPLLELDRRATKELVKGEDGPCAQSTARREQKRKRRQRVEGK